MALISEIKKSLQQKMPDLSQKDINKIAQTVESELFDFFYNNSFEIWNAGCTHRMRITGSGEKDFAVHAYDDPLHSEREYQKIDGALKYMMKKDEQ